MEDIVNNGQQEAFIRQEMKLASDTLLLDERHIVVQRSKSMHYFMWLALRKKEM